MKKIIFLSLLITFLSCKNADENTQENAPNEENIVNQGPKVGELPEYTIIKNEDVSMRTRMDVDAPINKRFTYCVLVSTEIKRNQIEPLFNELIKEPVGCNYLK